jgi:hypothetical protein
MRLRDPVRARYIFHRDDARRAECDKLQRAQGEIGILGKAQGSSFVD